MKRDYAQRAVGRLFGLDREKKIADSGIRNIFTPHQPISEVDLLFGRQTEVKRLVETLNTPGQHVLLYGERGVGKSSLANVVAELLNVMVESEVFVKRCDHSDTFESIMAQPLAAVGANLTLTGLETQTNNKLAGSVKVVSGEHANSVKASYLAKHSLSPSTVAEAVGALDALLVVDEADAVGNLEDRRKLAEVIKLLSDAGSKLKVMVVGIAATGDELTAAHPSVQRCLRETKLERMSDPELREIVESGSAKAGITLGHGVVTSIVQLSAGYPHFTHLIALKCAEQAVAEDRKFIDDSHLAEALQLAVKDAEGSMKRDFDNAVRSYGSDMYAKIVVSAADIPTGEFTAARLREAIQARTGSTLSQGSLNNYLKRLVSTDGSTVLTRKAKGVYCFTDPRMASFARMNALATMQAAK